MLVHVGDLAGASERRTVRFEDVVALDPNVVLAIVTLARLLDEHRRHGGDAPLFVLFPSTIPLDGLTDSLELLGGRPSNQASADPEEESNDSHSAGSLVRGEAGTQDGELIGSGSSMRSGP